jgi:glycosyltransferase involved in cell wall biosynthesis
MTIGIDGNEANVKNRVGTGVYTLELLKQFEQYSSSEAKGSREVSAKNIIDYEVSSRDARTIKFRVFLKEKPLADLPQESENFKYKIFGPKKFWTQFALPIKLTVGQKPDVFFSPAHYGPRFSKVPYVVTIHDLSYLRFPELFRKEDLVQLTNWSKYSILKSSAIIVPSKSTKDDIIKNYDVSSDKITVIYEGYNKEAFKPQSPAKISAVKKQYKIAGEYIVFVGTLQPRKNIERLIEAFSRLALDTLSLVIVGKKGWMYDQILRKSKDLDIDDKVIFTDFVPDDDLPSLISGAKVYINPSLWEGFGIPVIEAQACGVPVAVSNTSSLPEIISPPSHPELVSGSLFDPTDVDSMAKTIQNLLTNEKTRTDLIKKGNANTKRFSWESCAGETIDLLTKFASK